MGAIVLTLSITSGQLVKLSFGTQGGLTLLDVVVIILCALGGARTKLKLAKPPLWIKIAFVFIFIALISLALTPITLTQPEYLTSISYTVRFSLYILLGWLIYSDALPALRGNTQNILLTSGVLLAVLGLLQFIFLPDLEFLTKYGWDPHYFRTASTFLDPNFLGAYLVLTLILLLSSPRKRGSINNKRSLLLRNWIPAFARLAEASAKRAGMTIMYLALLTTFSRGAYLAFLTAFLTLSLLNKSLRWGIVTIILFLGLMIGFSSYQRFVAQPRNIDREQSAGFRFSTWQQGWKIFQNHPILGVGFNAYRYALKEYKLGDEQFLKSHGSSTNDSSLLYVAATTGVIGLISYVFFLGSLILTQKTNYVLIAGIFGLLIQSFFANTLFYPFLLIWIILIASQNRDTNYST